MIDRDTADKIGFLIGHADNGCDTCVAQLCEIATATFSGWRFVSTGKCAAAIVKVFSECE